MDFAFDEAQELLRETTRRFLEERHPIGALRANLETESIFDRDVWREGAELGWTSMLVPEEHDGGSVSEQPVVDLVGLAEELGRVLYPGPVLATNVVADAVASLGDEAQRKETLRAIARGDCVATWCASGDGASDPAAVEVEATATADGLRLDGVARYVHEAHNANLLLVTCNAAEGPTLVLVPRPDAGVGVRVLGALDLTRRFCEVTFESVEVPGYRVLGAVGGAASAVERAGRLATVLQAAEAVGAAERLFEVTVQYAKDRFQFGRAIGSFQAIKHRLADLLVEVGGVGFTWEYDVHLFLRRAKVDQLLYGDPAWHRERLCSLVEASVRVADELGGKA
jgi:alkylation response protein AidB-like acyl-CoA dehydrogenase